MRLEGPVGVARPVAVGRGAARPVGPGLEGSVEDGGRVVDAAGHGGLPLGGGRRAVAMGEGAARRTGHRGKK